jgi:hypothetical protein
MLNPDYHGDCPCAVFCDPEPLAFRCVESHQVPLTSSVGKAYQHFGVHPILPLGAALCVRQKYSYPLLSSLQLNRAIVASATVCLVPRVQPYLDTAVFPGWSSFGSTIGYLVVLLRFRASSSHNC